MKISVSSRQAYTDNGKLGVFLFIASPLLGSLFYAWFVREKAEELARYSSDTDYAGFAAFLMVLAGVAWSVGVVLMLVGRHFHHEITLEKEAPTAAPPAAEPPAGAESDWSRS